MNRIVWLLLALLAASPTTEVQAAASDIFRDDGKFLADAPYTRYLSTYNLDAAHANPNSPETIQAKIEAKRQQSAVQSFWLNSLSVRSKIKHPSRVSETLYRIDIRDYKWDTKDWEGLTKEDSYFAVSALEPSSEYMLRKYSQSAGAILRLDYFVVKTSLEPHYSRFLGLPPKLADLEGKFFVNRKAVEVFGLSNGGSVLESIVAHHNRQLERWRVQLGYWWQSRDSKTSSGKQNVLEAENVFTIQHDAGEFIWSLPNGLQAYYLANVAGDQQVEVPADIALDSRTTLKDKRVRNAMNCVTCHAVGINSFENVIARMHSNGATIGTYDKELALKFEEYHLSPLAKQVEKDCEQFADALAQCHDLTPEQNAKAYESMVSEYLEGRVDLTKASRELGCSVEHLQSIPHQVQSGTFNALLAGESISRDAWESIYIRVAKYCCEVTQ